MKKSVLAANDLQLDFALIHNRRKRRGEMIIGGGGYSVVSLPVLIGVSRSLAVAPRVLFLGVAPIILVIETRQYKHLFWQI